VIFVDDVLIFAGNEDIEKLLINMEKVFEVKK